MYRSDRKRTKDMCPVCMHEITGMEGDMQVPKHQQCKMSMSKWNRFFTLWITANARDSLTYSHKCAKKKIRLMVPVVYEISCRQIHTDTHTHLVQFCVVLKRVEARACNRETWAWSKTLFSFSLWWMAYVKQVSSLFRRLILILHLHELKPAAVRRENSGKC